MLGFLGPVKLEQCQERRHGLGGVLAASQVGNLGKVTRMRTVKSDFCFI